MKTIVLAAAAVLSLGMAAAYADGGDDGGTIPNTYFTELPGVDAQQGQLPNNVAANVNQYPPTATTSAAPAGAAANGS